MAAPPETSATTTVFGGGGGGSGGGSNMVSRDDTASMHRLIARWLRDRSEALLDAATGSCAKPADSARSMRALLHSVGILAVFFRYERDVIRSDGAAVQSEMIEVQRRLYSLFWRDF